MRGDVSEKGAGPVTEHLRGVDPYDALAGSRIPAWVRGHARARQVAIQLRKRLPIEIGGILGVEPFVMAKTVGCALAAAARTHVVDARTPEAAAARTPAAPAIAELTESLVATGGSLGHGAYGYEFDVQTRWAYYAAGSPNLIATVFVARGLGAAGIATGGVALVSELQRSAAYVREHLYAPDPQPAYRYTLTSETLVHNASLMGAGLVAMAAALAGDAAALDEALGAALVSVAEQRADGSWPYGVGESLEWSDNFHTAYNLDGLLQVWLATGDARIKAALERGVAHWTRDFFESDGAPKYYMDKALPYDIHSAGTAIDVAARLATWGWETAPLAEQVAEWTERHLVDSATGATYYQKRRFMTDRRHFVRWGDAHLALGRASLELVRTGRRDPLEDAVARASGVNADAR